MSTKYEYRKSKEIKMLNFSLKENNASYEKCTGII